MRMFRFAIISIIYLAFGYLGLAKEETSQLSNADIEKLLHESEQLRNK